MGTSKWGEGQGGHIVNGSNRVDSVAKQATSHAAGRCKGRGDVPAVAPGAAASPVGTKTAFNVTLPFLGENFKAFETRLRTTYQI